MSAAVAVPHLPVLSVHYQDILRPQNGPGSAHESDQIYYKFITIKDIIRPIKRYHSNPEAHSNQKCDCELGHDKYSNRNKCPKKPFLPDSFAFLYPNQPKRIANKIDYPNQNLTNSQKSVSKNNLPGRYPPAVRPVLSKAFIYCTYLLYFALISSKLKTSRKKKLWQLVN